MSVVACQVTEDAVYVGADSALTYGDCMSMAVPNMKLFVENGMVAGYSGNLEHANILRFFLRNGVEIEYTDKERHVDEEFAASIYVGFSEYSDQVGVDLRNEHNEALGEFVLAFEGKAFLVHGLLTREVHTFEAVGCGEEVARAAQYNGASLPRAIDTAIQFNRHCSYPIEIYRMDKHTGQIDLTTYNQGDMLPT